MARHTGSSGPGERYTPTFCQWERTPRWMFWKPAMRRITKQVYPAGRRHSLYEYQSPEFVLRETLEERFGPKKN